jgi:hypothetical protein
MRPAHRAGCAGVADLDLKSYSTADFELQIRTLLAQ